MTIPIRPNVTMTRVKMRWENITKSAEDKRLYRGLELNNGLRVILVSDPTTDQSAASLSVNIGMFPL